MRHPDITILTAPAPNAVSRCTVQVAGPPTGISTYYYWIVARYPIGRVVSSPFLVTGAPQTRNAQNYIVVSWTPLPAVLGYDVLRTNTDHLPSAAAADIALTTDLTTPRFLDQGQPLSPYNLAGLTHGAPTDGWAHMNNRDYGEPVLELYPGVHVTKILFPDGTEQDTAAAAGAAGSNGQIQFNETENLEQV